MKAFQSSAPLEVVEKAPFMILAFCNSLLYKDLRIHKIAKIGFFYNLRENQRENASV
jgi:hypothetical protein